MKTVRSYWLAGWLVALFVGVSPAASAAEILLAGAASLTNAFRDIAEAFSRENPDDQVVLSFAASDVLLQQIIHGAPADIFASADQTAMDKAVEAGVADAGSRQDFVRNQVVLVVPASGNQAIRSVADLDAAGVTRVALGNPDIVPAGRYTREALQHIGQWSLVESRQVLGQNVRQVLDYVARDEVDAGFVFATDAALMPDRLRVVETLVSPRVVSYPIALVERPGRNPRAQALLDYIVSAPGQAILERYGFSAP